MFVASTVVLLVMLVLYIKYYKLNGDFYKNMLSALQSSRDEALAQKSSTRYVRAALHVRSMMVECDATDKQSLLAQMVNKVVEVDNLAPQDEKAFLDAVMAREALGPTGIADGIAIPHAKSDLIKNTTLVIAKLSTPIDFNAPDGKPCDLVCLLASVNDGNAHLNVIGRLGLILDDEQNQAAIRSCSDPYQLVEIISQAEKKFL